MRLFSIIIPVLNEASEINAAVERIYRESSAFDVEVIVIDSDAEGRTISAVNRAEVILGISTKGRGKQMNRGAFLAKGDILLFLHSDTELPDHALHRISSVMGDPECVGGAFDLGIKSDKTVFRVMEGLVYARTRLTRIPYGDQALFVRKEVFDRMKGLKEIPLMEDLYFMRRLRRAWHKIRIIPQRVRTSPRRWEEEGVLFCTLRNWLLRGLYHLGAQPENLVRFYYRDWEKGSDYGRTPGPLRKED